MAIFTKRKNNKLNIVLIGFMGCGKTSVGRKLSIRLKREFIDTDDFIVKREGMSINEIFNTKGEDYFRNLEMELCKRYSQPKGKIIATGGGIIKNDKNVENLKNGGKIIYLKSTPEQIAINLKYDDSRPLLQGGNKEEKIAAMMEERRPLYEKCADFTIDVTDIDIDKTIDEIIRLMKI
ncbi:MAG: shikimate kinase [Lachnospirales bacterium]